MKFDQKEVIFETSHWITILSQDQTHLGRCVIVLKRACGDLAELNHEELIDFLDVVKKLEAALRKSFDATMFNWSCLMNNAYQNDPPDPQVHWHVRPRYNHKVEFGAEIFEDKSFGHHYARNTDRKISEELSKKVILKIRGFIQ